MEHPGEATKLRRKRKKFTIRKLAEVSKLDPNTISRFERGGDFKFRVFAAVCKALGCTPNDVYAELAGVQRVDARPLPEYCEDSNPEHVALHKMLSMILHSDQEAWKVGITQNLKAMSLAARANLPTELEYFLFSPNADPLPGDKMRFYNDSVNEKRTKRRRN
jgi:transcriptional regulator with XRE-family HTH domain